MAIAPRIGRWEVGDRGEVALIGQHCTTCGETLFPERPVCSKCGHRTLEEVRIEGPATLASYTVVHQVPSGFSGPMAVGYAALPGGVMVLAPIDADPSELHRGLELSLHEGVTSEIDGAPFRTYRFRPAARGDANA
jgi:uncharacterized OB-fold protein